MRSKMIVKYLEIIFASLIVIFRRRSFLLLLTLCSIVLTATLYVIGYFFEISPKPVEMTISRTCSSDAGPISLSVWIPANGLFINMHGDQEIHIPESGSCSFASICLPPGRLQYAETGADIDPNSKTPAEMCWNLMTKDATFPPNLDRSQFTVVAGNDINRLHWTSDKYIYERISFARWAFNLVVKRKSGKIGQVLQE